MVMPVGLVLESDTDVFQINELMEGESGIQFLSGALGLGLPPVSTQWIEGAGDGAIYRGRRVLPRDIDLPIYLAGKNREDLKAQVIRLSMMLSDVCTLRLVEDGGLSWSTKVVRVGG